MVFRAFLVILSVLLSFETSFSGGLYLLRKGKLVSIVFTASERHQYDVRLVSPGEVRVLIYNAEAKPKSYRVENAVVKSISLRSKDGNIILIVKLDPSYALEARETYPPFKLVLVPVKTPPTYILEQKIKDALRKGDCETVLSLLGRLPLGSLSLEKRKFYEEKKLFCALEEKNYPLALSAVNFLLSLKKEERLWVTKIEILFKLKNYEEVIAEGTLFLRKYGDELADHVASIVAEALIKLKRINNAIILLKRVIKRHPKSPFLAELYKSLGKAYYLKGNFIGSYLLFARALQMKSEAVKSDPEALFMYGSSSYRVGEKDKALKILLSAFNAFPKSKEAAKSLALIGDIYREKGKWELAKWFYGLCLSLFPGTKAAAISKIHIAEYFERKGNLKKALNIYTEILVLYPNYKDVLEVAVYRRGVILLKLKRYEDAIEAFKEFILKFPGSKYIADAERYIEEAEFRIAEREFKAGRFEEALKKFAAFALRYPQNPHVDEAVRLASEALVTVTEARYGRGDCYGVVLFWDGYKNFFPKEKRLGVPLFHVAECLLSLGRRAEALKELEWIYEKIGGRFPERKALLKRLGEAYVLNEDYKKAERIHRELLFSFPVSDVPESARFLLKLYFAEGRYKRLAEVVFLVRSSEAPRDLLRLCDFYEALSFLDAGKKLDALRLLDRFKNDPVSGLKFPDLFAYSMVLTARIRFNLKSFKNSFLDYLRYLNAFPKAKDTAEALFMAGFIERLISSRPRLYKYLWGRCLKEFPESYWSKEIKARELIEEIKKTRALL